MDERSCPVAGADGPGLVFPYHPPRLTPGGAPNEEGPRDVGLKVSVDFWTEDLTGSLPETARFFSKQRVPPHPGDTLFVNEETTATRSPRREGEGGSGGAGRGASAPGPVRVRVMGTFRVTGRFWSVPGEELTVNVRPVGDGGDAVRPVEGARERPAPSPWTERDGP